MNSNDDIKKISSTVLNFVKDKKRIVMGGYALNILLKNNGSDSIYSDVVDPSEIPDIDVYSPDPISDLFDICNIIHKMGYKRVQGKEGIHKDTYKLFVDNENFLDLGYVPKYFYDKKNKKKTEKQKDNSTKFKIFRKRD